MKSMSRQEGRLRASSPLVEAGDGQRQGGGKLKRWRKVNVEKKNKADEEYHRRRRRRGSTLPLGCKDLHSQSSPRRSPRRTWCSLCHKCRSGRVLVSIHPCRCTTGRLMCSWKMGLGKKKWRKRTIYYNSICLKFRNLVLIYSVNFYLRVMITSKLCFIVEKHFPEGKKTERRRSTQF